MPRKLELSLALDTYDRTQPLVDGRVSPDGIEFIPFTYKSPERHRRMLKHREFDVCELSLASYLASVEEEDDYEFTAIPVFPHRKFRHGYFFVHADAGIESPKDLEGKRVGIRRWQNTASLWMRGIAHDYYDVDVTSIQWCIDDQDEVPPNVPSAYDTERIPPEDNINDMLVSGDLDAAMYPKRPSSFVEGTDAIERLFPNYKEEEIRYYQDTELFPIMHVVVIKDSVVEEYPWVPMNVRKAFEEAKEVGLSELDHTRKISIVWAKESLEEQRERLGWDLWPNNVTDNRDELSAAVSYAAADGLLSEELPLEDLFVPSSLEDLPGYA